MIKEYCEKNNYDIVDVYNDAGHSGKDLMRPEMQKLLKDIKSHKIEKFVLPHKFKYGFSSPYSEKIKMKGTNKIMNNEKVNYLIGMIKDMNINIVLYKDVSSWKMKQKT